MDKVDRSLIEQIRKIPLQSDGFPIAGMIIELFLIRKGWSQAELARELGLSHVMVHKILKHNAAIELERRRFLCKLLGIPPILLGLGTLEQLHEFFRENEPVKDIQPVTHQEQTTRSTVYRHILDTVYKQSIGLTGLPLLEKVEYVIQNLDKDTPHEVNERDKRKLLYLKWEFHRQATAIYSNFLCNANKARRHINSALDIAINQLRDSNLVACILVNAVNVDLLEDNIYLARIDIDAALPQLKNASPIVQCEVYGLASRIYHLSAQTSEDRINSRAFLDRSQVIYADMEASKKSGNVTHDRRLIPRGSTILQCQFTQFDSMLALGHVNDAMDKLGDIEDSTPKNYTRTKGAIFFNNAQCYRASGYPQIAVQQLSDSFDTVKETYDLRHVKAIHKQLQLIKNSKYGNSPDVQDLELAISNFNATRKTGSL
jgi:transcriptional regulator with XRE-family HTH domain